ncbi:MAG: hypothetical protein RXR06_09600 [Thermoproteus sp.]
MRLVEFNVIKHDVYTILAPKPSLRLNPDGVEMEAVNPSLLLPYSIEVLRIDIMGQFYSYTRLALFDQISAVRRVFRLECLKADNCIVSAGSKRENRENMDVSIPSALMSISLVKEFAAGEGRIWLGRGAICPAIGISGLAPRARAQADCLRRSTS